MITCSQCGSMIEGNPNVCPACGAQVEHEEVQKNSPEKNPQNESKGLREKTDYEDNRNTMSMKSSDVNNEEKRPIVVHKDIMVRILLFILVACVGYLTVSNFREKNNCGIIDSSNRVLVVHTDTESSSNQSDVIQIKNALNNGGMIRMNLNNISSDLKQQIESYGAKDVDGSYWVTGALLNYIASRGWHLIQTPWNSVYYFER